MSHPDDRTMGAGPDENGGGERPMEPIPVAAAEDIARTFGYDQVIIVARRVGEHPEPHGEHVTTYGEGQAHKEVAAKIGNFLKFKIFGWEDAHLHEDRVSFQGRVNEWMLKCFGSEIAADRTERNHRFLEEALELVQSLDCTASEAHQLVDYVFGRPVGEPDQEAGGVNVTFAALCTAAGLDMRNTGEAELARISHPETIKKIRAKQAAKPDHSPLPGPTVLTDEEWHRRAAAHYCKRLNLAEGSCDDLVRTLVEDGDFIRDYADDPEGAVDEELSNWND